MTSISAWFAENAIDEVEAIVPDMTGIARGKILPAQRYLETLGMRVPEQIFLQTVSGSYPDEQDVIDPADIDIMARPDPRTMRKVPWTKDPTALIIHDCFYADGRPVDIAPRFVLRSIVEKYREQGWEPVVAPELEFYLVKPNTDADYPLEPPIGRSGRSEAGRQSFSIDAVNEFDPLFEDLYDHCEAQGIEIATLTHEAGAVQMEVNLRHGDPIELADQAFLFKRAVRETSLRHGVYATFMGKPMENEPGSAMHIHQSVTNVGTGRNVFSRDDGEPSELFFAHLGGLQTYLPAAMPFFAPNVNSYRRLTPDHAAPINAHWGYDNRTTGLRVPIAPPESRRVENRVAGADANPYLAIAVSLACGYLGMMENLEPDEPLAGSAYTRPYGLPRNLEEAVRRLRDCGPLARVLGERFVAAYNVVKEAEYVAFLNVISSWEREHLLLNV